MIENRLQQELAEIAALGLTAAAACSNRPAGGLLRSTAKKC
jgi:hypothetical protein